MLPGRGLLRLFVISCLYFVLLVCGLVWVGLVWFGIDVCCISFTDCYSVVYL